MDANVVRCFIAVHLPAEVRAELTSLEDRLKAGRHPFVKWVDPGSLHLTLKFLGNAAADSIPRIVDAMSRAAGPHAPFRLRLAGTGAFPGWQHPQVVWVGVEGDLDRLTALQKDLEAAVSPLGFPAESRSFSAHLTLGRLRDRVNADDRRRFAQFAQSVSFETSLSFEVDGIRLIKSQLTPAGPIYTDLATAGLGLPPEDRGVKG
jgi:RNA 2',3'-cyclic 3'-phosphodiesterase